MAAFCSVSDITDLLEGVSEFDTDVWTDDKITTLLTGYVQPYFEEVLCKGRTFESGSYTEVYDGTGTYTLQLSHHPLIAVTALTIDDTAQDLDTINVYVYKTRIALDTVFPIGRQNISITYTAGYSSIPGSVKEAVAMLTAMHIARVCGGGGGAIASGITAGPIALREAFTPAGKYSDKIHDWNRIVKQVAKHYGGSRVTNQIKRKTRYRVYEPRTDRWINY